MSWQATSYVLQHSESRLGDRLVLFVLADKANEDGTGSWPSVDTISRETRMSERAVRYSLRRLEESGEILPTGTSPYGTFVYTVVIGVEVGGANIAPGGAIHDTEGGQNRAGTVSDFAPNPPLEPPLEQKNPLTPTAPPRGNRKRELVLWEKTALAWAAAAGVSGPRLSVIRAVTQLGPWDSERGPYDWPINGDAAGAFREFCADKFASSLQVEEKT